MLINLFALLGTIFWIWMLIDVLTNKRLAGTDKLIWVLVVVFLYVLGALIYFFLGRKK